VAKQIARGRDGEPVLKAPLFPVSYTNRSLGCFFYISPAITSAIDRKEQRSRDCGDGLREGPFMLATKRHAHCEKQKGDTMNRNSEREQESERELRNENADLRRRIASLKERHLSIIEDMQDAEAELRAFIEYGIHPDSENEGLRLRNEMLEGRNEQLENENEELRARIALLEEQQA
jgi:hypothetical protein